MRAFVFPLLVWSICSTLFISPITASAQHVLARGSDGSSVNRFDIQSESQRIPEASRALLLSKPDTISRIAEGLLLRRVLAKKATELKLDEDPVLLAELEQARDKVLSEYYLKYLDNKLQTTQQGLERYAQAEYQTNITKYSTPTEFRARHILVRKNIEDARSKAMGLLTALRAGASFEDLAKKESDDPGSAARGGDLGFFPTGRMVKPFEDAVNTLKNPGDLSDLVETQFGYHIIRLEERKAGRTVPFEEVKDRLVAEAKAKIQRDQREQVVEALRQTLIFDETKLNALAKAFADDILASQAATSSQGTQSLPNQSPSPSTYMGK